MGNWEEGQTGNLVLAKQGIGKKAKQGIGQTGHWELGIGSNSQITNNK